ncbi:MAG: hypothetical protein Q9181_001401 [Wetmoreana brouardii]
MFSRPRGNGVSHRQLKDDRSVIRSALRAVGLELLAVVFHVILQLRSLHSLEPKKVVIKKSRPHALARCAVHIIPTLFSIVLLALNLKHYYIGNHFTGLITDDSTNRLLLQGAAKIHELLITSSLATVVFDVTRNALIHGDGIPLGLLGSGFAFTQLSFFWSPDFWCAIWYRSKIWRKVLVVLIVIASGFLAVTAGPACAVLVIPRIQPWSAGGTFFYLNGSENQFWPKELSFDPLGEQPYCASENATSYSVCPSSGYNSLWGHFHNVNVSNFVQTGTKLPYAGNLSGLMYHFEVTSPTFQVPLQLAIGAVRNDLPRIPTDPDSIHTFIHQPHAASIIPVRQLTIDWWNTVHNISLASPHNIARYRYTDTVGIRSNTRQAAAIVRCSQAQNVSSNARSLQFPLQPFASGKCRDTIVPSLNTSRADHIRYSWYRFPQDQWGPQMTVGAYIEMPWTIGHESRIIIGCSIEARYESIIVQHAGPNYAFHSNAGHPGPSYSVNVSDSWLKALNPKTPQSGPGYASWKPSTIESIITASGVGDGLSSLTGATETIAWNGEKFADGGNRTTMLEILIASQIADGLSRFGSHRAFNTTGPASSWPLWNYERATGFEKKLLQGRRALVKPTLDKDVTELRADFAINGYSFKATEQSDKLAMAVFVAHMIIALAHTIWVVYHGTSSGSWDNLTEYFALLQNSRPAYKALENTGAGVRLPATYRRVARIRVAKHPDSNKADHVELIFEEGRPKDDIELRPLADAELRSISGTAQEQHDDGYQAHLAEEEAAHQTTLDPIQETSFLNPENAAQKLLNPMHPLTERIRPQKERSSSSASLLPVGKAYTTATEYFNFIEIGKEYS